MSFPRVILSADPFDVMSAPNEGVDLRSDSSLREGWRHEVLLAQVRALGFRRLSCSYSPDLLAVLQGLTPGRRFDLFPVVPNMDRHGRQFQNYGLPGAAVRMLRELRPDDILRLGVRVPRHPGDLLRRDFGGLVSLLTVFEIERLRPLRPRVVLLHPLVSDLMLANRQFEFLSHFGQIVSSSLRVPAGVMTENLGWMLREIDEFGAPEIKVVAGPVNVEGDAMRPSQFACERAISLTRRSVIATHVTSCSQSLKDSLSYVAKVGVDAMLLEPPSAVVAYQLLQTLESLSPQLDR